MEGDDVSYGDMAIIGQRYVGGICGENGRYENCVNKMNVSYGREGSAEEYSYIGGIVGETQYGIDGCSNSGMISYLVDEQKTNTANFSYKIGGIVGATDAKVSNCTNSGTVKGKKAVGGIIGYTSASAMTFEGNKNTGKIVGYSSYLPNAYNCNINAAYGVGGLIGMIFGNGEFIFRNCENSGILDIYGSFYGAGGFVGTLVKTTDSDVILDYVFDGVKFNYTIDKHNTKTVWGAVIGACGTVNGDESIDLDKENAVVAEVNEKYNSQGNSAAEAQK
jgi:hypothetical protein